MTHVNDHDDIRKLLKEEVDKMRKSFDEELERIEREERKRREEAIKRLSKL